MPGSATVTPTMSGPPPTAAAAGSERLTPQRVFAFLIMVFGMFMSILDIQVVSASLSEIQAGLSASSNELSWVQTAYLIAEVIAIPLSGFMSRALGTRYLFATSAAGFTAASLMCGLTSSIEQMILWRAIQGFLGAGMITTVFASAYTVFPRSKMYMVAPVIGLVATLAPTVGPTIGGYLTEVLSWHWLFFINVLPGIGITIGALALVDFDKPNLGLLDHFDWVGLASMAGFLGALEYVLEEGPQYDWLEDTSVATSAVICGLSAIVFFYRVLTAKEPIVDIRAFKNKNFAFGCMFSFCLGIGLYGLTYVYPRYLAEIRGYSAMMIGETMFISGIVMLLTAPLAGRMMQKVDTRLTISLGLVLFAMGTWQMTWITIDYDFWELLPPQVFRGCGMMMAMVPVNDIALGTLPPSLLKNASGLFNLTRNLGGAVGLALINTVLNRRTDLHISRLQDNVNWGNTTAVETLNMLTEKYQGMGDATTMALKQLSLIVHRQASVMSYADVFLILTILYLALSMLAFIVDKPNTASPR